MAPAPAAQQTATEQPPDQQCYDAFNAHCPSRRLLDTIGDKWASLVVVALGLHGPLRYSELSRRIDGVSQKMLTQTLRDLERDGLVSRTVTPSVPVRVDYALTPLGATLLPVVQAIKDWAETHIEEVMRARDDYDARHSAPTEHRA